MMIDQQTTSDNPLLSLPKAEPESRCHGSLQAIEPSVAVANYIEVAHSKNTRLAYRGDLLDFLNWGGSLPSSPELLAAYVADRATVHSPHTLARRLVGVSRAHSSQGLEDPTKSALVRVVLRGVKRQHGRPQRQAMPLLKQDLLEMLSCMRDKRGVRDRALLLLGFAAALRRSELVGVDVEDLTFSKEGLLLNLRRSKTDQTGEGRKIAVPYGRTSACPVEALINWLAQGNVESNAVFRSIDKAGAVGGRLSAQSVSIILKSYALRAGLPTSEVSGHSLRAGFVTSAAVAGAAIHKIQQQTGHKSLAMLSRYIRDCRLFVDNACASVL